MLGHWATWADDALIVDKESGRFADAGIPVRIVKVSDAGRFNIVETRHGDTAINLLVNEGSNLPTDGARIRLDPAHTQVYADGWIAT